MNGEDLRLAPHPLCKSIASESPFAQAAIEYEIEMLPLRYGKLVVGRCIEMLGADIISCLSFITNAR
jgi:hypothetical protein